MRNAIAIVLLPVFMTACVSFVNAPDKEYIKEKEKGVFVLKKDIELNNKKLKKGDEVKVIISMDKDWIKVHAYPANVDPLKADRFLILYLFEDDFPRRMFNSAFFNEQFSAVAGEKGTVAGDKKKK